MEGGSSPVPVHLPVDPVLIPVRFNNRSLTYMFIFFPARGGSSPCPTRPHGCVPVSDPLLVPTRVRCNASITQLFCPSRDRRVPVPVRGTASLVPLGGREAHLPVSFTATYQLPPHVPRVPTVSFWTRSTRIAWIRTQKQRPQAGGTDCPQCVLKVAQKDWQLAVMLTIPHKRNYKATHSLPQI